jgi:hypothetical protein
MIDLQTAAEEMNAAIQARGIHMVYCTAGKRALKFWKRMVRGDDGGYGISAKVARSYGVPV